MGVYSHNRMGYNITCSAEHQSSAEIAQGFIGLVLLELPNGWEIKSTRFHWLNVVSCDIFNGRIWTLLISAYLLPSMLNYLQYPKEALQRFKGMNPIFSGDLNVDLDDVCSLWRQRVADLLTEFELIDLVWHFHQ